MGTGRANEKLADLHFAMHPLHSRPIYHGYTAVTCNLHPKTRTIGIFHGRIIDTYNTMDKYPVETMCLAASWNYHAIYGLSFSLSNSSPSSSIPSGISAINEGIGVFGRVAAYSCDGSGNVY
jgi:hypothetical protein